MTAQELYDWINVWREKLGWPNRALYALADSLCDFDLEDVTHDVLTALAAIIPHEPPPVSRPWAARLGESNAKSAGTAILDGLASAVIKPMTDPDPSTIRSYMHGLMKRPVQ